jgi:sigma-B regulation protein RsbQ
MDVLARNAVTVTGRPDGRAMMFSHGFGCDQNMWRLVTPAFADRHKIVLFDHVGSGRSDLGAYDRNRYGSLRGYAEDVLEICRALDLRDVIFVGHSVSAMIGALAANAEPARFGALVMVGPSPCYLNDGAYPGGFERADIDGLIASLEANYLGWSSTMAPAIMGNPDRPELGAELNESFCRTDPDIARHFARVTFLSDNRADLPPLAVPTLVLQCSDDMIAGEAVGRWVHDHVPGSRFTQLAATGHCPHLSAPDETAGAIEAFLRAA